MGATNEQAGAGSGSEDGGDAGGDVGYPSPASHPVPDLRPEESGLAANGAVAEVQHADGAVCKTGDLLAVPDSMVVAVDRGLSSEQSGESHVSTPPKYTLAQRRLVRTRAFIHRNNLASRFDTALLLRTLSLGDDFEGTAPWWEVGVHLITTMLGAGVLALPYAFACLGWVWALLLNAFVTLASWYSAWLMATLHQRPSGRRIATLKGLAEDTLGTWGRRYAFSFQMFILCFASIAFLVLGGQSLYNLVYSCYGTSGSCIHEHGQWPWVLVFSGAMMVLGQLPNFHSLSVVSVIGSAMPVAYVALICIAILVGGVREGVSYARITGSSTLQSAMYFLQGLGSLLFAFGGQVVQNEVTATLKIPPPLRLSMQKALGLTYSVIAVCHLAMACVGYGYYGNANTTGNVVNLVPYKAVAIAANVGVLLHVGAAVQVLAMPVFMEVEKLLAERSWANRHPQWLVRLVWRSLYIAVLCFVAALIPFFAALGGLIGGLGNLPLCYILPILMWNARNKDSVSRLRLWAHRVLATVLLLASIAVSMASIYWIAQQASSFRVFP